MKKGNVCHGEGHAGNECVSVLIAITCLISGFVLVYRSPPSEGAQGGPGRAAQNLRPSGESVPGDRHPEETGPREHREAGGGENA